MHTAGIVHPAGVRWHTDLVAPEGLITMRAALYLDSLGPDDGCLSVIPGSHWKQFREELKGSIQKLGVDAEVIPGRHSIASHPGDVIFMNHKLFHAALRARPGRRAIHVGACQNPSRDEDPANH